MRGEFNALAKRRPKCSGVHPFSGNVGAIATRTIQSRNKAEIHDTPRKKFSPIDHVCFTKCAIFRAVS